MDDVCAHDRQRVEIAIRKEGEENRKKEKKSEEKSIMNIFEHIFRRSHRYILRST